MFKLSASIGVRFVLTRYPPIQMTKKERGGGRLDEQRNNATKENKWLINSHHLLFSKITALRKDDIIR